MFSPAGKALLSYLDLFGLRSTGVATPCVLVSVCYEGRLPSDSLLKMMISAATLDEAS